MSDRLLRVPVPQVQLSVPQLLQDIQTYQADLLTQVKGLELIAQNFPLNTPIPMRAAYGFQYVASGEYGSGGALDDWTGTLFQYYELYKEVVARLDDQVTKFIQQDTINSTTSRES